MSAPSNSNELVFPEPPIPAVHTKGCLCIFYGPPGHLDKHVRLVIAMPEFLIQLSVAANRGIPIPVANDRGNPSFCIPGASATAVTQAIREEFDGDVTSPIIKQAWRSLGETKCAICGKPSGEYDNVRGWMDALWQPHGIPLPTVGVTVTPFCGDKKCEEELHKVKMEKETGDEFWEQFLGTESLAGASAG
jgi:hypothetical protein